MVVHVHVISNPYFVHSLGVGILTYADYLFLITALVSKSLLYCGYVLLLVLNIDEYCIHVYLFAETTRQFEIAFKMIDEDKSDYIDLKEFSQVQEAVSRQRDHTVVRYVYA